MKNDVIVVVLVFGVFFSVICSPWIGILVSVPALLLSLGHHWLYLARQTLGRDLLTLRRLLFVLYKTLSAKIMNHSVAHRFMRVSERYPDKTFITFCTEDGGSETLTFREVRSRCCQVARCFEQRGYKKGDVVAIVFENRVDYCCYWLGLSMLGVIPALINSNLRKDGLLHTIQVAKSKAVVFSAEMESAVMDVYEELKNNVELYAIDPQAQGKALDLTKLLDNESSADFQLKYTGYNDDMFYIYTSGTTGLPKAAIIKSSRFMFAVYALYCMTAIRDDDVLYSPLPMYHTAAGAMIAGNAILEGVSIVSRKKFSARNYWSDCAKHNVTASQYIGEVARYLYMTPPSPYDTKHKIRLMVGNGMRPDIWEKFTKRFQIPMVNEFYGSTEGNCSVGNISGKPGSVGFISVLFPFMLPLGLIRVDEDTREPLRDENGLCIPCPVGQPGELVGRIDKGHPVRDFHGYADRQATSKKILENVWRKGDKCFRSGDILEMDELGWLYFKDRAGDTFRWKGENVSTTEVEAVCSNILALQDCVVYGVEVPGCEGRAGMLAIPDPDRSVKLEQLYADLDSRLPAYAKPIFVRIVDKIQITATFKLKKRELQREGFRIQEIKDPIYIIDNKNRTYVELTDSIYSSLEAATMKL